MTRRTLTRLARALAFLACASAAFMLMLAGYSTQGVVAAIVAAAICVTGE